MANVIEFVFGFIIDAISFSIPDLLLGLPRVKLQKKIAIRVDCNFNPNFWTNCSA